MQQPPKKLQGISKILGAIIVVYVGAYALNSALGGYWPFPTWELPREGGNTRSPRDRVMDASMKWQPRFGHFDANRRSRCDVLGYFFAPLIASDQQFIHRRHRLMDSDSKSLSVSQIHPKIRRDLFDQRK